MPQAVRCGRSRRARSTLAKIPRRAPVANCSKRRGSAGRLQRLTSIWTTPGFTDEVIHLYLASGLTPGEPSRERDEFIEVVPQPLSQVLARIRDGEVRDAKTIVAILYMAGFVLKM